MLWGRRGLAAAGRGRCTVRASWRQCERASQAPRRPPTTPSLPFLPQPASRLHSFLVRAASSAVLVAAFVATVHAGHVPLTLMVLGIQVRWLGAGGGVARAPPQPTSGTSLGPCRRAFKASLKPTSPPATFPPPLTPTARPSPPPPIPSKPPRYPASISLQYLMVKELFALADAAGPPRAPRGSRLRWYIFGVAAFWLYARLVRRQLAEEVAAAASGGAAAAAARWLLRRHALAAVALYTAGFVAFVLSLVKGRYRDQFRQHAWTHLTLLFVFVPSSLFVANIFDGGIIWFLLPTSLVIVNDCGAYLAGKGVGRGGAGGGRGGAGGGWSGGGAREQPATPTFAVRPWRPSPQPLPRPCQASFLAAPR